MFTYVNSLIEYFLSFCDFSKMSITADQCRAARALLGWTQKTLADLSGIGTVAINQFENETSQPRRATVDVVKRAFESAGVEFINENGGGPGVRFRKPGRR